MESIVTASYIKPYFSGLISLNRTLKDVQALYDPVNAFRFNLFNFWYPGENKLSQILAFFLDPKQTHGQGDVFLKIFLNQFGLTHLVSDTNNVNVKCEYTITYQRRIDILISFYNDKFAIGIENKFGAGDQVNQLHDYAKYFKDNFNNHVLFYLTPKGGNPSLSSINKENYELYIGDGSLQSISYTSDIIDLINKWSLACQANRVRYFLNDFEQYFKKILIGDNFMNEHQIVADYALSTPENLTAAFDTFKAFSIIKEEIAKRFTDKLAANLKTVFNGDKWDVICSKNLNVVVNHISWPSNTYVGIRDFDHDRVHFSVKTNTVDWQGLFSFVKNEKGGSFNSNNWWLKLEPAYNRWDENIEGITALYNLNDDAISYMIDGIVQITDIVNRFSDYIVSN
ncbi:uncharacterized protein (DUF427 family) [Mucilaginibacter sp. UYP25]|uniref:PDDEXK-like family protein n=1 Tax=unclassified Mucilaginibacter TaxID=2617802 RepID=UPI003391E9EE